MQKFSVRRIFCDFTGLPSDHFVGEMMHNIKHEFINVKRWIRAGIIEFTDIFDEYLLIAGCMIGLQNETKYLLLND